MQNIKKNALPNDNLLNPVFEKITTNDQKKLNDEILENWVAKYDKYLEFQRYCRPFKRRL